MDCPETIISSIEEFISKIKEDTSHWKLIPGCSPWFRGQSSIDWPLLPGIMRKDVKIEEAEIISRFRKLAPMFGDTPQNVNKAEWLYLMQHVGVPTRLLDWSEGALIGLYFAVHNAQEKIDPGVWVIHPLELNKAVIRVGDSFPDANHAAFISRCDLAFKKSSGGQQDADRYPLAIIPTYTHPRMKSQRGCFTLHGSEHENFEIIAEKTGLIEGNYFHKYRIPFQIAPKLLYELRVLGSYRPKREKLPTLHFSQIMTD